MGYGIFLFLFLFLLPLFHSLLHIFDKVSNATLLLLNLGFFDLFSWFFCLIDHLVFSHIIHHGIYRFYNFFRINFFLFIIEFLPAAKRSSDLHKIQTSEQRCFYDHLFLQKQHHQERLLHQFIQFFFRCPSTRNGFLALHSR